VGQNIDTVHQFHSGCAEGDGVTNGMFFTQRLLRELGYQSEIFVEHVPAELIGRVHSMKRYSSNAKALFLQHHSMGHDVDHWLNSLTERRVIVYHNITPAHFFPDDGPFFHYSVKGRQQLSDWRADFKGAIADSPLNAKELNKLGYSNIEVIPLLVDCDKLVNALFDSDVGLQVSDLNVLFVGRLASNKSQHQLIEVIYYLKQLYSERNIKLWLAGSGANTPYGQRLQGLIEQNDLIDNVTLLGKVPDPQLLGLYRQADVLLCMSEHEGFGMPLIESMLFSTPVLALNSSNIKDTLGKGGIVFNAAPALHIAALIKQVATDESLHAQLLKAQNSHIQQFQSAKLKQQLDAFINRILST